MRQIRIIRPKRLESGANKLQVMLDGQKAGDLGNGKEITLSMDEKSHEISGKGGLLAGKGFAFNLAVPAGNYSYTFQIDMVNAKSGYTPVLRPTDGRRLKDDVKVRTLIGVEAVTTLLRDDIRARLTPGTEIRLAMLEDKWQLTATENGNPQVLYEQGYTSTIVAGILLGGLAASLDKMNYDTPEHRQETTAHLFENYFLFLPDYECTGDGILRFKG